MERFFTKTFYKFFFGFVAIITVAFGVLVMSATYLDEGAAVDSVASPQ